MLLYNVMLHTQKFLQVNSCGSEIRITIKTITGLNMKKAIDNGAAIISVQPIQAQLNPLKKKIRRETGC